MLDDEVPDVGKSPGGWITKDYEAFLAAPERVC